MPHGPHRALEAQLLFTSYFTRGMLGGSVQASSLPTVWIGRVSWFTMGHGEYHMRGGRPAVSEYQSDAYRSLNSVFQLPSL